MIQVFVKLNGIGFNQVGHRFFFQIFKFFFLMMSPNRRDFIKYLSFGAIATLITKDLSAYAKKAPQILLRSGWQVENIGDIAHTPGLLHLLEMYIPDAQVTFWPYYHYLPKEEVAMLKRRFPKLNIVEGKLDTDAKASNPELDKVISQADFFLHSSGPATIGWADAVAFKKRTGKSYGVYGVSYGLYGIPEKEMLSGAAFVYFRDSVSLAKAKEDGVNPKVIGFAPDAAFAFDIENKVKAAQFLKDNQLEAKQFLCCIPKHRATPVWLHEHKNRPFDAHRNARNEAMMEHDHLPLRQAIIEVVRKTKLKVLVVAEDITQVEIGKTEMYDKLPADVQKQVVWRSEFWMPDEALSIYKQSAGLFSHEMHSPIMCIGNGIPALVCRWAEQSSKGMMWRDIDLGNWLFNFDIEDEVKLLVPQVLAMAQNPEEFTAEAVKAQKRVQGFQKKTMAVVKEVFKV
jgi:polysaccharide pyruvyl transferase WcaK-like protein